MCHDRCCPGYLVAWSAGNSLRLVVSERGHGGVKLGDVRVRQELPIVASEDAPCEGCDVDGGDLLPGLSSACGVGVEGRFDEVVLGGHHSIGRRVFTRDGHT